MRSGDGDFATETQRRGAVECEVREFAFVNELEFTDTSPLESAERPRAGVGVTERNNAAESLTP